MRWTNVGFAAFLGFSCLLMCNSGVRTIHADDSPDVLLSPFRSQAKATQETELEKKLSAPCNLSMDSVPLRQVLDDLRHFYGFNIWIDNGANLNHPVTVKVENVTLKSALPLILSGTGLTYSVKDKVLQIRSKEASAVFQTRSYLVADLVIPIADCSGSATCCRTNQTAPTTAVSHPPPTANQLRSSPLPIRERELIESITGTIAPDSWADVGGLGSIDYRPLTMSMVINQTAEVHKQIADYLSALRGSPDLQVALEVRLISTPEEFVDFVPVQKSKFVNSPNGNTHARCEFLSVRGPVTFLDKKQVSAILETVQSDCRTNILQAPKVTLMNGQQGVVCVEDKHPYVTGVDLTSKDGNVVIQPRTEVVKTGFRMVAKPVVSADGRYAQVSLRIEMTDLATGQVPQRPVTVGLKDNKGNSVPFTQFIQQPIVSTQTIEGTATIPDGGTVLLGGLKKVTETRREVCPEFLGDIPILNRMFTTVAYGKETDGLLVLVTPRIIRSKEPVCQTGFGPAKSQSKSECQSTTMAPISAPIVTCSAVATCEQQSTGGANSQLTKLLKAYDQACAENRYQEARRFADAALAIDPTCFRHKP